MKIEKLGAGQSADNSVGPSVHLMCRCDIGYYPLLFSKTDQMGTSQGILNSLAARLVVAAGLVSTVIWIFWFDGDTLGYIFQTSDGATSVSAGTSPQAVVVSLLFVVFYCALLNNKVELREVRVASIWIRVAAFGVDFWVAIFTLGSLFGLVPVLLEAARTHVFQWHFERHYATSADAAGIGLILAGLCAFVAYFALPLLRRTRQLAVGFSAWPQSKLMDP